MVRSIFCTMAFRAVDALNGRTIFLYDGPSGPSQTMQEPWLASTRLMGNNAQQTAALPLAWPCRRVGRPGRAVVRHGLPTAPVGRSSAFRSPWHDNCFTRNLSSRLLVDFTLGAGGTGHYGRKA